MAGTTWIQFDEPALVMGLEGHHLDAFSKAYSFLEDVPVGIKLLVETYFADIPVETYR
jgi:5-methyltetrahydropteroyltriglutamate--homocysteine methyltransferase